MYKRNIERFYTKNATIFKKPLERIINNMISKCRYKNGESLERHNFGDKPVTLNNIPTNINSPEFENTLLESLENNENQKSIIELLWGDIQLGKRIQACIIMWVSVYVLKRPVLYIFRNLNIDQTQLETDIKGVSKYDYNIQYIRKFFDEVMNEEIEENDWKDFKLPELKKINRDDNVIDKLFNKDALNPTDILCCLMNYKQLEKINISFNKSICKYKELLNITLLVDESDLYAPTASNNSITKTDLRDSTKCEELLAKIYKKVRYVLHITGTAHSLLYNVTTRLTDNQSIQIPISKVHKMKRIEYYYGLFNNRINFETTTKEWWNDINPTTNKKNKYTIEEDYNININPIITKIRNRPQNKYYSFLISEEKIRTGHFLLARKILEDFQDIFVIVFHGKCLRLYLQKKYQGKLKLYSQKEKRLYKKGGIYGSSKEEHASRILPNNYCYYELDKSLNIKQIYKLLAMFFKKEKLDFRTVITITGKYGERGYSFTSDDYDEYQFHLTDQYFPCHVKNKNCTDISQRLRLQGKYKDHPTLTLWTSNELKDIIINFFIPFMKNIEDNIMDCNNWHEIKELIENTISTQENINLNYMKYIDVRKKRKNIKVHKNYEKKHKGFRLIKIGSMTEEDIQQWCFKNNLPKYECINNIVKINEQDKYKYKEHYCISVNSREYNEKDILIKAKHYIQTGNEKKEKYNQKLRDIIRKSNINRNNIYISTFGDISSNFKKTKHIAIIDKIENITHIFEFDKNSIINKKDRLYSKDKSKLFYTDEEGTIWKSEIKPHYRSDPNYEEVQYYWITPDGWLFLHDPSKSTNNIMSIEIVSPELKNKHQNNKEDSNIKEFIKQCFKNPEQKNLRIGITEIMKEYKKWCIINKKTTKSITRKELRNTLQNYGYTEEKSKGIDVNGKSGKRGFHIDLKII
jgi:hypothetical protein